MDSIQNGVAVRLRVVTDDGFPQIGLVLADFVERLER